MTNARFKRQTLQFIILFLAFGSFLIGSPRSVHAGIVGPNCGSGSCFGSVYNLSYATLGLNTYQITLTVDTASTFAKQYFLNSIAVKTVPNSSDILNGPYGGTLPNGFIGKGVGSLGANGCKTGSAGFACATYDQSHSGLRTGVDTYTFQYDEVVKSGTLMTGTDSASIKALYLNSAGFHDGLTSVGITLSPSSPSTPAATPEPSTIALFGTGIFLMAFMGFRKRDGFMNTL
ncbi:MAG: PEP-CTERM sorting domain-containing protein [Leptospirales bacterium]